MNLKKFVTTQFLSNYGDSRGFSFVIPSQIFSFLETVQEMHIVQLLPDAIRGNHYHQHRKEVLIVVYKDDWLWGWQQLDASVPQQQIFSGQGAVLITLEAQTVHAIKNIGQHNITVVSCSNLALMDTVRQVIME
jgi:dTDP-4-dehydrorhamnose 3,5-epimerase-like enzyme